MEWERSVYNQINIYISKLELSDLKKLTVTAISILLFIVILSSCQSQDQISKNITQFSSKSNNSFEITFGNDKTINEFLADSTIVGSDCEVSIKEIDGLSGLEIKTNKEFSDALINLRKLFGYDIDFTTGRYLSMKLYVPSDSWICAMKYNFKDSNGNNGGCKEIYNNFYGYYDQWLDVVVDVQDILPDFQNWSGNENSMKNTTWLSLI